MIYSILRATSKVGIPAPGNDTFSRMDYVTDRYISSWLGKGVMVFIMGIAVFFLVYRQLPETPMPGSPNWEYARMEAREAELKAEWAARMRLVMSKLPAKELEPGFEPVKMPAKVRVLEILAVPQTSRVVSNEAPLLMSNDVPK